MAIKNTLKHSCWGLFVICTSACAMSNPAKKIEIKTNPFPQTAYIVTIDATQAPGPMVNSKGSMTFETAWSGEPCMKKSPPLVEWHIPRKTVDVSFKQVSYNTFEAVVYLDWVQDERYFNKGLCAWKMNIVTGTVQGPNGAAHSVSVGSNEFRNNAVGTMYYRVDTFDVVSDPHRFIGAQSVPTNDFKDLSNSYVNDKSKYFPLYLKVRSIDGALGVEEEFLSRTHQNE